MSDTPKETSFCAIPMAVVVEVATKKGISAVILLEKLLYAPMVHPANLKYCDHLMPKK